MKKRKNWYTPAYDDLPKTGMLVIGTADEINAVMQAINPHYPRQNLENAGTECFYTIGGVHVELHIRKEKED